MKALLIDLYYLFSIIFLWTELNWILNPQKEVDNAKYFSEANKIYKDKQWSQYEERYKDIVIKGLLIYLPIFIWVFLGLFTAQWVLFLFLMLWNIIIIYPLSKISHFGRFYLYLHWVNSLIGVSWCIFLIVNHYHLHIKIF